MHIGEFRMVWNFKNQNNFHNYHDLTIDVFRTYCITLKNSNFITIIWSFVCSNIANHTCMNNVQPI